MSSPALVEEMDIENSLEEGTRQKALRLVQPSEERARLPIAVRRSLVGKQKIIRHRLTTSVGLLE